jgi:alginate O-acetyltransferase complex protein AlgI
MLFYSPAFFLFFFAYFAAQLVVRPEHRLWLIVAGGALFYSWWNPSLAWLPLLLAFIGWTGALWISASSSPLMRKIKSALVVAALTAPLLFFKYTNFVLHQVTEPLLNVRLDWWLIEPLPLGISFITLTMIAYVIDYYRGKYPLERRPQMVAAYLLFFPHLIAGPILRPHSIIPQLDRPRRALDPGFTFAVLLFTVGLAKKIILADQFAEVVNHVYGSSQGNSALEYLLSWYGFSAQIYCDFSGYTDMAIALALMLGVRLPKNFNRPYLSTSVAQFWRRWHITLSFWLRDYIYIPLGGNRRGELRRAGNILITMLIGGLWHGANWTFMLWGLLHGVFIVLSPARRITRAKSRLARIVAVLATFQIVTLLWIPFRAPDLETLWRVLCGPFVTPTGSLLAFVVTNAYTLLLLGIFFTSHPFDTHGQLRWLRNKLSPAVLWPATASVWVLAAATSSATSAKFIYFDF